MKGQDAMGATRAYVEHVAIRVRDLDWHRRFFAEVFGMTVRDVDGERDAPRQVWTIGGIQLIADPEAPETDGRFAHLGVMADDAEAAIRAAELRGVRGGAKGRNWLELPDGLVVEVLQAGSGSVAAALAVDPRR
jgi:catechol 2,3-dioxygenase-like lactoylglutathione lyase family enzyme